MTRDHPWLPSTVRHRFGYHRGVVLSPSALAATLAVLAAGCLPDLSRVVGDAGHPPDHSTWLFEEGGNGQLDQKAQLTESGLKLDVRPLDKSVAPTPDQKKPVDLPPPTPDQPVGRWYAAKQAHCATFCPKQGKASAPGPEGAYCGSGEVRPLSMVAQGDVPFPYGCWPDCLGQNGAFLTNANTTTGGRCYYPGQNQDNDPTDNTVGCYCK